MALEKELVIDKIEVLEDGQIQVRQATKIVEDGKEISKTYHRWVIAPGDDYSNQDDRVKAVAELVHTQEVIDNYKSRLEKDNVKEE